MERKLLVHVLVLATVSALERRLDDPVPAAVVDVQPDVKVPVLRTYRNAYGTHFDVSSTWKMLLGVYVLFVVGGFMLLSVIPVRFANKKTEAPLVLWFGSAEKKKKDVEEKGVEKVATQGPWRRASSWFSSFFLSDSTANIDVRYRFQADMTQQLAASAVKAKTYESVAILTGDLESPPEAKPQQKPHSPVRGSLATGPNRSSLFVTAPPSPPPVGRMRQGSTRLASDASIGKAGSVGRLSRVETKDDFVRAASHRQSIAARAEKRVALAKEDVSYENLEDDEMQVYEYLEFVRELLDGLALKKLCQKSGRVVSRKLHITADMKVVFWNAIGAMKRQTKKSSLRTELIDSVQQGLRGSAKVTGKSTPQREAHCVSIHCSDGKWLVLEAKTQAMRQRLFLGFTRLSHEKQGSEAAEAAVTISGDAGAKGKIVGKEVKHGVTTSLRSQGKLMSTAEADEILAEQLEYEEKLTPPQEQKPFQQELLLTRTHLRASIAVLGENEEVKQDHPLVEREEEHRQEHQAEAAPRDIPSDTDGVDIDNLSDDPELSRE
ncbi:hypothetical protein V7S43_005195 [Phytophthora oleae]|uniref:Uncharacterized protein n=1 Tax=Phytophthora oleae TaxID=2107226 RepID=A0ABD3FSU0_9STRA